MNILSIDQSITHSGIVIKDDDEYIFDTIKTNKEDKDLHRLIYIRDDLSDLIKKYNIKTIIREGFAFQSTGRSIFQLGGLGYAIDMLSHDLGKRLIIIPPTTHKKFTTGKGNSPKSVMLLHIYKKWDIELADDNIADALSMMKTYEAYLKYIKGDTDDITKIQISALEKMCKDS